MTLFSNIWVQWVILVLLSIIIINIISLIITIKDYFENKIETNENNLLLSNNADYKKSIEDLDAIIEEEINFYVLSNGLLLDDTKFTEEDENEMLDDITDSLSDKLLGSLCERKLNVLYNYETVPNIIASRIYVAVTEFAIKMRMPK